MAGENIEVRLGREPSPESVECKVALKELGYYLVADGDLPQLNLPQIWREAILSSRGVIEQGVCTYP